MRNTRPQLQGTKESAPESETKLMNAHKAFMVQSYKYQIALDKQRKEIDTNYDLLESLKSQVAATQTELASLSLQVMNAKLEVNNIRNTIENSTRTTNHYNLGPRATAPAVQPITQPVLTLQAAQILRTERCG